MEKTQIQLEQFDLFSRTAADYIKKFDAKVLSMTADTRNILRLYAKDRDGYAVDENNEYFHGAVVQMDENRVAGSVALLRRDGGLTAILSLPQIIIPKKGNA